MVVPPEIRPTTSIAIHPDLPDHSCQSRAQSYLTTIGQFRVTPKPSPGGQRRALRSSGREVGGEISRQDRRTTREGLRGLGRKVEVTRILRMTASASFDFASADAEG